MCLRCFPIFTMDEKKQLLSAKMRICRKERGMTQEKAAEQLNVSVRWYRQVERGEAKPGFSMICEIAWLFNMSFAEFSNKNRKEKNKTAT